MVWRGWEIYTGVPATCLSHLYGNSSKSLAFAITRQLLDRRLSKDGPVTWRLLHFSGMCLATNTDSLEEIICHDCGGTGE